ncbi:transposase family protein, partial [Candidatus Bathyarchaeota archaeon]|nr:transposase family protein [Candidatus Bathyarchaeota archaeon]
MDIQTLYKKYNYPSKQKLYTLAKLEGVKLKLKEIDSFLSEQYAQQIYSKKVPQKRGHIVSFLPDSRYQMDLIDMSNFSRTNGGFKWILTMVDIFNRKLYAYLLKNKTKDSI